MTVLNLSHNSLGRYGYNSGTMLIKAMNEQPELSLKHVDMSYNFFDNLECISMEIELSTNRNIYGFHMEGNDMNYMDP